MKVCTGEKDLKFMIGKLHVQSNYIFQGKEWLQFSQFPAYSMLPGCSSVLLPGVGWQPPSHSIRAEIRGAPSYWFRRLTESKQIHSSAPFLNGNVLILSGFCVCMCVGILCLLSWLPALISQYIYVCVYNLYTHTCIYKLSQDKEKKGHIYVCNSQLTLLSKANEWAVRSYFKRPLRRNPHYC